MMMVSNHLVSGENSPFMPITKGRQVLASIWLAFTAMAAAPAAHAEPLPISRPQVEAMGLSFARAEAAEWVPVARLPAIVELAPDSRTIVAARYDGSVRRTRVVDGEAVAAGRPLLEVASPGWAESLAAAGGRTARLAALERQARRSAELLAAGVIALWLAGEYVSVPASVGFIALRGIAVLNGTVMVGHFNDLRARPADRPGRGRRRPAAAAPGDDDGVDYRLRPRAAAARRTLPVDSRLTAPSRGPPWWRRRRVRRRSMVGGPSHPRLTRRPEQWVGLVPCFDPIHSASGMT